MAQAPRLGQHLVFFFGSPLNLKRQTKDILDWALFHLVPGFAFRAYCSLGLHPTLQQTCQVRELAKARSDLCKSADIALDLCAVLGLRGFTVLRCFWCQGLGV